MQNYGNSVFVLNFLISDLIFYVIHMHMITQPLYIVCPSEMSTFVRHAGAQKLPIASFHV